MKNLDEHTIQLRAMGLEVGDAMPEALTAVAVAKAAQKLKDDPSLSVKPTHVVVPKAKK
jgi:hypothetical protein